MLCSTKIKRFFFALILFSLTACGSGKKGSDDDDATEDGGGPGEESPETKNPPGFFVDGVGDLPACSEFTLAPLAYVASEEAFYTCKDGGWVAIDLQGPKGDKGDNGNAGANGSNGTNGTNAASFFSSVKSNGTTIGWFMGLVDNATYPSNAQVLTSKGFAFWVNTSNGLFSETVVPVFTQTSCAGTVHVQTNSINIAPRTIVRADTTYYYVASSATPANLNIESMYSTGTGCVDTGTSPVTAWPLTANDASVTGFTPPAGASFATPITIE